MKVNRRKFLKMLGVVFISPLLEACAGLFGNPTSTPTTTSTSSHVPPTTTRTSPSPTETDIPPSVTPTETEIPTATSTATGTPTEIPTGTPSHTPTTNIGEFFSLNPVIETNPDAVFIKRTNIPVKTDTQAKLAAGFDFAQEIFRYGTHAGIPLSHKIAIKANVTYTEGMGCTEAGMGIITDVHFSEGLIDGMKAMGFQADNMYLREGNWLKDGYCAVDVAHTGYEEMANRTGIHALCLPSGRYITDLTLEEFQEGTEVVWKECPHGTVFKRIGYLAPYNQAGSWLLNIAKFKTHGMGMTLCVKNLQGMCASPYVRFCEDPQITLERPAHIFKDFQPAFDEYISELHSRHLQAGFPRWDRPGTGYTSGFGMESWSQRTCDSLSVTNTGLNVIEGIYGRNGNGFMSGPGPGGQAEDFLTNLLIFGKDPFRVDVIGTWLAGHEPGNFGLFHIAKERGLCTVVDPWQIPVYLWDPINPQPVSLRDLQRFPLLTTYLRRDYNGGTEAQYHLVDEPFDYRSI